MDNHFITIHKTSYHSSLVQKPHEIILLNVHQAGNLRDIKLIIFHVFNLLIHLVKRTDRNIQLILTYFQVCFHKFSYSSLKQKDPESFANNTRSLIFWYKPRRIQ